jgi:hypothetical protein
LARGLAVASNTLERWIVADEDCTAVDGVGDTPIEEDFNDQDKAVEYFLKMS